MEDRARGNTTGLSSVREELFKSLRILWGQNYNSCLNLQLEFRDLHGKVNTFNAPLEPFLDSSFVLDSMARLISPTERSVEIAKAADVLGDLKPYFGLQTKNSGGRIVCSAIQTRSPAEDAGLMPGDVIARLENIENFDEEFLVEYLHTRTPGTRVRVEIVRGERSMTIWMVAGCATKSKTALVTLVRKVSGVLVPPDVSGERPSSATLIPMDAARFSISITGNDLGALSANGIMLYLAFIENLPVIEEYNYAYSEVLVFDIAQSRKLAQLRRKILLIQHEFERDILATVRRKQAKNSRNTKQNFASLNTISLANARKKIEHHRSSCADYLQRKERLLEENKQSKRSVLQENLEHMRERAWTALLLQNNECLLSPKYLLKMLILSHAFRQTGVRIACLRYIRSEWELFKDEKEWESEALCRDFELIKKTLPGFQTDHNDLHLEFLIRFLPLDSPFSYPLSPHLNDEAREIVFASDTNRELGESSARSQTVDGEQFHQQRLEDSYIEKSYEDHRLQSCKKPSVKHFPKGRLTRPEEKELKKEFSEKKSAYDRYLEKNFGVLKPKSARSKLRKPKPTVNAKKASFLGQKATPRRNKTKNGIMNKSRESTWKSTTFSEVHDSTLEIADPVMMMNEPEQRKSKTSTTERISEHFDQGSVSTEPTHQEAGIGDVSKSIDSSVQAAMETAMLALDEPIHLESR